jgi:hypothetical protein
MDRLKRGFLSLVLLAGSLFGCGSETQNLQLEDTVRANLQVTPYPLFDFGMVQIGQSLSKSFDVKNVGAMAAQNITSGFYLSLNFSFEGGAYPGTTGTCTATLAAGESCKVVIVFAPIYASSFSETVRISYRDNKERVTENPLLFGKGF